MDHDGHFAAVRMIVLKVQNPPYSTPEVNTFRTAFKDFMRADAGGGKGFLDIMGGYFSGQNPTGTDHGLKRIMLLEGNKTVTHDNPLNVAAGANADYAWITYWTNRGTNNTTWRSGNRPANWQALWANFLDFCYKEGEEDGIFLLSSSFKAELDANAGPVNPSQSLRDNFQSEGVTLSGAAEVRRVTAGSEWSIMETDAPRNLKRRHVIRSVTVQGLERLLVFYFKGNPRRPPHGSPYDYLGHPDSGHTGPSHYGKGAGALVEGFTVVYDEFDWTP